MKNLFLTFALILFVIFSSASELVIIHTRSEAETNELFSITSLSIHYFNNDFIIATSHGDIKGFEYVTLDKEPWANNISYYLVYTIGKDENQSYKNSISGRSKILYEGKDYLIVSTNEALHGQLPPAKNDGMVKIFNNKARLPVSRKSFPKMDTEPIPFVTNLLNEVNGENITATVQHLQNYGTRDAYSSFSVDAQRWIGLKFEDYQLAVETMDFPMPSGSASDNLIAIQEGSKYPNEYVIIGAHYDSRSFTGDAPGADDNASGTAGVLEIARILSQYEFDRTIVYCAFSGEEYGLYGSYAYAYRCLQESLNILGYINMDMIGYLKPGNAMLTSLIYPNQARELADFYTAVCEVYLPDFIVQFGMLTGGDSDHTSFNNNGFMGIFPFENVSAYSPYIHTTNDIVGLSYNSEEQAVVFTKAVLASVALLSKDEFTGIETQPNVFGVYPNPATDQIDIKLYNGETGDVEVFNLIGEMVYKSSLWGELRIATGEWAKGIYVVKVKSHYGTGVQKIIIR